MFGKLEFSGSQGTYKEVGPIPFKPEASDARDVCGICAKGCPVRAIDKNDPRKTAKELCISCMRCQYIHPKHTRDLDSAFMAAMAERLAPKLGGRKENYLFICE